jgi:hypothetical protein
MRIAQHSRPLWVGALACAFTVPTLAGLMMALSRESIMIPGGVVFLAGIFITAPVSLLVAMPIALALRRLGQLNAVYFSLIGSMAGAAALGIFAYQNNHWAQMQDQAFAEWVAYNAAMKALLPGGLYGLISALAFAVGAGFDALPGRRPKSS